MDDQTLLLGIKDREQSSLEEFIRKYGSYLYAILKNVIKRKLPKEEVLKLAADSFVNIWCNTGDVIEDERSIKQILAGFARNRAIKRLRFFGMSSRRLTERIVLSDSKPISKNNPGQIEGLIAELSNTIGAMTDTEREIYMRRFYFGEKFGRIARKMHLKRSAVKKQLSSAKAQVEALGTRANTAYYQLGDILDKIDPKYVEALEPIPHRFQMKELISVSLKAVDVGQVLTYKQRVRRKIYRNTALVSGFLIIIVLGALLATNKSGEIIMWYFSNVLSLVDSPQFNPVKTIKTDEAIITVENIVDYGDESHMIVSYERTDGTAIPKNSAPDIRILHKRTEVTREVSFFFRESDTKVYYRIALDPEDEIDKLYFRARFYGLYNTSEDGSRVYSLSMKRTAVLNVWYNTRNIVLIGTSDHNSFEYIYYPTRIVITKHHISMKLRIPDEYWQELAVNPYPHIRLIYEDKTMSDSFLFHGIVFEYQEDIDVEHGAARGVFRYPEKVGDIESVIINYYRYFMNERTTGEIKYYTIFE